MKRFVVLCFFGLVALTAALYSDKYDAINIEEILNNPRLLQGYFKCMIDQGKCTAEAKVFKSHLKEILVTHCAECTAIQIADTKLMMKHLINKEPEMWKQICDKYDPQRIYAPLYEEELREV